jgi:hypothetical protein
MADKTLELEADICKVVGGGKLPWPHVPDIGSERYLVNVVRDLPERAVITEKALIMGPEYPIFKVPPKTNAHRVNHVLVYCNALSHGLNFGNEAGKRTGDRKMRVALQYISVYHHGGRYPTPCCSSSPSK